MKKLCPEMTLSEWAGIFLADYVAPSCKPSALEHYADNLNKHLLPELGSMALGEVSTADIQKLLRQQEQHGNLKTGGRLSAKSLRNLRTATSACFSRAVEIGLLNSNPVTGTVIHRAVRSDVEVMEDRDLEKLRDFICRDSNLMNVGIYLAAEFALRRGEVCALRWGCYDGVYLNIRETVKRLKYTEGEETPADGRRTHLVFNAAKSESSIRHLAVSPVHRELLEAQRERFARLFGREAREDDFIVYNAEGGVTDPDNLSHYFADVLDALQIPHVKLHALRHTFASRAIELGVNIDSVSGILGHSSVMTTSYYYLRPRQQSMNEAMWRLSGMGTAAPTQRPRAYRGAENERKHTRRKGV